MNYKQAQFELFPASSGHSDKANKPRYTFSNITLSWENIVILSIFIMLSIVLSFSFGVEKGKRNVAKMISSSDKAITKPAPVIAPTIRTAPVTQVAPKISASSPVILTQNNVLLKPQDLSGKAVEDKEFSSGTYTIQVASYKKIETAKREAVALKKKGYDILVLPKGDYSIICIGQFAQKEEAKMFLTKLKKTYKDCLVRRL